MNAHLKKNHFGERMRQYINEVIGTQEDAAKFFGRNRSSISRWCTHENPCGDVRIWRIVKPAVEKRGHNPEYFRDASVSHWTEPYNQEIPEGEWRALLEKTYLQEREIDCLNEEIDELKRRLEEE